MATVEIALLAFTAFGFPLLFILFGLLHFLYPTRIIDELFNERHFTKHELAILSSFPFSLLRTLAFIRGTVVPTTIRARFGHYNFRKNMSRAFYFLNVTFVVLLSIAFAVSICLIGYGIVATFSG